MDNAGWQARRRAAHQAVSAVAQTFVPTHLAGWLTPGSIGLFQEVALPPSRGPDGRFRPVTQIESMGDVIIGGWSMPVSRHPSPAPAYLDSSKDASGMLNITPPPRFPSPNLRQTGYPFVRQPPGHSSVDEIPLSQHRPVERSQILQHRKTFMDPYLQFICGPLLRYDNVDEHGVWNGAALIVSKCCVVVVTLFVDANNLTHGGPQL